MTMNSVDQESNETIEGTTSIVDRAPADASLDGEELLKRMRDEAEDDLIKAAARDEFVRRANQFDLFASTLDLIDEEPFYGYISRRINKIRTLDIPTAAVTVLDDVFVMMWNPTFFTRIAPDAHVGRNHRKKIQGVLMHEFWHLILQHVGSRLPGIEHKVLWNWGADLAINCMLPIDKLPDGLLCPGRPLDIPAEAANVYDPKHLEQYKQLSALIEAMPVHLAAEDYYGRLLNYIQKNSPEMLNDPSWGMPMKGSAQAGDGDGDGDGDPTGDGDGQPGNDPKSGKGGGKHTSGWGRLGQFDEHDKWGTVPEEEKEFLRQRLKNLLSDAVLEADNAKNGRGWGSVPHEMQQTLRRMVSDQVDWRNLLRQFVGYSSHMNNSSTLKRINRRYPYIHPGRRRSRGARIRIYIDQSGSVSDENISLLFAELDSLAKKVEFEVYFFDTEVDEVNWINWTRGSKHPPHRTRSGGTDFNAATNHANRHREGVDGIIILTDGECSKPGASVLKRAWIIVPDSKLMFSTDELVIQMSRETHENKH
jgi:predicted metal-dependent peptidase